MSAKTTYRALNQDSLPEAIAFCCAAPCSADGAQAEEERRFRARGIELLNEELYGNIPMGCSPRSARKFVRAAQQRVDERLTQEVRDPACGFPILAALSIIGFLWKLWEIFSAWMWPKNSD